MLGPRTAALALLLALAAPAAADDEQLDHWAWKAPARPPLPAVRDAGWVRNPIDAFVLARLEKEGLRPTAPASREVLIRRVTFDLTGLPPAPEEVDRFVNDPSPDAYEKLIDRLLASPAYGERWGRHWLDLARYADSNGYEFDEPRPDAWRYRDYVIRSFNSDKPFDRFVKEQLAGDELSPGDPDALIATGFNLLGPDMTDASDQAKRRQDTLNDMTDTAGLAFLGLTVGCARCHDHKFEPLTQQDYFRLQAFFAPAAFRRDLPITPAPEQKAYDAAMAEYTRLARPTLDAVARLEEPVRRRLFEAKLSRLSEEAQAAHRTPAAQRNGGQQELVAETARLVVVSAAEVLKAMTPADQATLKSLQAELKKLDGKKPAPLPVAMGLRDAAGPPPKTFVLRRGELGDRGEEVQSGAPAVLLPGHQARPAVIAPVAPGTGRRSALADWVASPENPLTTRVIVNRLWQHHFGRGIVGTPSDFGLRGERPTHPELLDWLASEFVARGWSLKAMHRLMLTSATYRQASRGRQPPETHPENHPESDPDNKLLWRMNRQRLEGEAVRDTLLAVCGRLDRTAGGPGVFPPLPAEIAPTVKGWAVSPDPRDRVRRSVYTFARRNLRDPFLEAFDLPDSNLSCPRRERSTTAPQALTLFNDAEVAASARALAARIERDATAPADQIERAYRLALGRRPSADEAGRAAEFLARSPLSELCRALFNLNEFVYVD
jgi:hypothetical protein